MSQGGFTQAMIQNLEKRRARNDEVKNAMTSQAQKVIADPNSTEDARDKARAYMDAAQHIITDPKPIAQWAGEKMVGVGKGMMKWGSAKEAKGGGKGKPQQAQQGGGQGGGQPSSQPQQPAPQPQPQGGQPAQAAQPSQRPPDTLQPPSTQPPQPIPGPPVKQHALSRILHGAEKGLAMVGGAGLAAAGGVLGGASRLANGPQQPPMPKVDAGMFAQKSPEEIAGAADQYKEKRDTAAIKALRLPPDDESMMLRNSTLARLGIKMPAVWKEFENDSGMRGYYDLNNPSSIPPGYKSVDARDFKIPKGWDINPRTGQAINKDTGKSYSKNDPNLPPEAKAAFAGAKETSREKQANAMALVKARTEGYGLGRFMPMLDTHNGNAPAMPRGYDLLAEPGRYIPAGPGEKALAKENLFQDIADNSKKFRTVITNLKDDFPPAMKAKIIAAMRADDPHASLDQLIAVAAIGDMPVDQQDFLIGVRQIAENGMVMRGLLGAGQGSDDVRNAIRATLPGLLTTDKSYALRQLDAFDQTLSRLHRGIPKVALRNDTGADGSSTPPQRPPSTLSPTAPGNRPPGW
jgi:hypothetical protein